MNLDRLNILLVCNLGYSTGIMVAKMKEVAASSKKLQDVPMDIIAYPAGELREHIENYDVILVGPQIKHQFAELKKLADEHNKPIEVIDSKDYGTVNGANILKSAILLIVNHEKGN